MEIILASASSRRKEILKKAKYDFKIVPSNYDENISNLKYSKELIENCAYKKALDVLNNNLINGNFIIISADTVVVADNKILGKPKDEKDAFLTLKSLSDKAHFVQTSVCLLNHNTCFCDSEITHVTFRKLKDDEIINYIKTKKPFDKAGSYAIQDEGFDFVLKYQGNIDNVIGFPMETFTKLYKKIKQ